MTKDEAFKTCPDVYTSELELPENVKLALRRHGLLNVRNLILNNPERDFTVHVLTPNFKELVFNAVHKVYPESKDWFNETFNGFE